MAASSLSMESFHGTTILSVRRGASVALGGDGQVTLGNVVVKATARKVRRIYNDRVLAGFAGATADAFTLFERFEALNPHPKTSEDLSAVSIVLPCASRRCT